MGNNGKLLGEDLSPGPMKVNLGAGRRLLPGFINTDLYPLPGIDRKVDLYDLPLPWEDSSVDMVTAIDVMEHVRHDVPGHKGNFFMELINDILRILKPGGVLEIHAPHRKSFDAMDVHDHVRVVSDVTFRPWMQELYPTCDNRVLSSVNGVRLELVKKKVGRYLQVGPLSDWHFRRYLGLEVGAPQVNMLVFKVKK